jgi:hypothetical protein
MRSAGALLCCLLVIPVSAFGQSNARTNRVSGGVEGGLALATLSSYQSPDVNEAFDTSVRNGATLGAFVLVPLGEKWSLQPEVLFVQKGAKITFPGSTSTDAVVDLRYLEFPVLLTLGIGSGSVRGFVNAGPTFAFKLHASVDASDSGGPSDVDIDSQVRRADAGIAVGGGVEGRHWSLGVRLVQGFIDIGNSRQVDDVIRTRTVAVVAGVRF